MANKDVHFIVGKIRFLQIGPLFQNDDAKPVARELLGEHAARGAGTHDHEIYFVGRLIGNHGPGHFVSVSGEAACHPG